MKKTDINQPPCYFDKYINCLENIELSEAFSNAQWEIAALKLDQLKQIGDSVYAEGKWTIKDIFQHLIDAERIMAYRALRIGRNDKTPLSGFDQDILAANISTQNRTLESILEEFKIVRRATTCLFETFTDEALQRIGISSGMQMSALAFGFAILGHQKYHLKIIEEKYSPLVSKQFFNAQS